MKKDKSQTTPDLNLLTEIDEKTKPTSNFYRSSLRIQPVSSGDSVFFQDDKQTINQDFETLKNENFTSRLPAIADLLNLPQKSLDPHINNMILDLTKYAQNLEHVVRFKNKEIQRLEYINKYLVISQQKRDEMLTHILEENRKLKEFSTTKSEKKLPAIKAVQSPGLKIPKSPTKGGQTMAFKFEEQPSSARKLTKKPTETLKRAESRDFTNFARSVGKTVGFIDDRKGQSILKMSEDDVNMMYQENEGLQFLERMLSKGEDGFCDEVKKFDNALLTQLYDSIFSLRIDHKNLLEMIFKLKRIIKAATSMGTSLVLNESIERVINETCDCLDCERASLFIYDSAKDELWSKVAKGSDATIRVPSSKGIVGHVYSKGEPMNILNAYADERFNRENDMKSGFKTNTILAVPIKDSSNKVIGVCQAINKKAYNSFFTKDDEGLLNILSLLAGVVLRNAMTYDEQVNFLNSLRNSLNSGIKLCAEKKLKELMPVSERMLQSIMGVEKSRIVLKHPKKHTLFSVNSNGDIEYFPLECGIIGAVMETAVHLNITNGYGHHLFNGQVDIETNMPLLCMPIKHPKTEKVMGAIEVVNARGIQGLSASHKAKINIFDAETLEFFTRQFSQAVLNCYDWERKMCEIENSKFFLDEE